MPFGLDSDAIAEPNIKFALEQRWSVNEKGQEVEIDSFRPFHNADPYDPEQMGEGISPRWASWKCKDYSLGAPVRTPYRRDQTTFPAGYSGFKPMWCACHAPVALHPSQTAVQWVSCRQPDTNPIQGGRSDKLYNPGKITKPGYSGFRPGEKADPYIDFKVQSAAAVHSRKQGFFGCAWAP